MMYLLLVMLLAVGLYGIFAKRNLLKKIIGVVILEHAVNLFLILIGYRESGIPPILLTTAEREQFLRSSVDPLPQALVLTSIVIGLGLVMLMAALSLRVRQRYGTLDTGALNRLRG